MKINRWGDALGVRFPSEFVRTMRLRDKIYVEMTTRGDEIIIKRAPELLPLEDLIANCSEWDGNPPEKYDWGEPQGRELI